MTKSLAASVLLAQFTITAGASAQAQPAPSPPPPPATVGGSPAPGTPASAAPPHAESPPATPPPPPTPPATTTPPAALPPEPAPPTGGPTGQPAAAAPPNAPAAPGKPEDKRWYDIVKLEAFVDTYASVNYNFPKPESSLRAAAGGNALRAYDVTNGFALHWAGLNASIDPKPIGGTLSLRFGPSAQIHNANDAPYGLANVKQAFVSWKPLGAESKLTLDLGKYDEPYGSEVGDSQYNINYTRSALFWLAQPAFFTGLRVDYAFSDAIDLKLLLTNGWNNSVDINRGKSGGFQLNIKPYDKLLVSAGYMLGPEQPDYTVTTDATGTHVTDVPGANNRLRHIADLILDFTPNESFRALLNADFVADDVGDKLNKWYGVNLALRYAFNEKFSAALRGEYFGDPDGIATATGKDTRLVEGTLTLGYTPIANLIFKLDQRVDVGLTRDGTAIFPAGIGGASKTQITTTLGVVATTN